MQRFNLLTQAEIEKIHENSLRILENIGVVITYQPAKDVLAKAGAKIDGDIVRIPKNMVEEAIRLSPSSFTMYARNPEKNVLISTENTVYAGPNCPPFVSDLDYGRRDSTLEDFKNLIKIIDKLENVDIQSQIPCEPNDVPIERRSYEMLYNTLKYSEKPFMGSSYGYEQAKKGIEMASIAFGGMDVIRDKPVMVSIPCTLTPLSYADNMIGALMAYAEARQPQMINSLAMAGITTPATLVGLVSVQNAEVLAGIVLAQTISPETPVIYAAAGSNCEMSNMMLSIGSPEDAVVSIINGQLCDYYNIPCRTSGALTDSKIPDAQAGYEAALTLLSGPISGGNFMLHAVGILDSYNTASYEQLIIDNEIVGYVKRIMRGVEVNDETLAYDVIEEIGPQGNFLVHEHTLEYYRDEFYRPTLSDRRSPDQWEGDGSLSAAQRANAKWKEILADYGESTLPAETDKALKDFMDKI